MPSTVHSLHKKPPRAYLSTKLGQFDVGYCANMLLMKDISRWIRSREKLRSIFQSTYASRSEGIAVSAHHLRADFNLSQLLSLMRPKRSLANCRLYLSEISSIIERHHAQLMELPHDALAAVVKRKKGSDSLVTFRRGTDGFYAAEEPIAIEQATPLSADTILLLPSQRR